MFSDIAIQINVECTPNSLSMKMSTLYHQHIKPTLISNSFAPPQFQISPNNIIDNECNSSNKARHK